MPSPLVSMVNWFCIPRCPWSALQKTRRTIDPCSSFICSLCLSSAQRFYNRAGQFFRQIYYNFFKRLRFLAVFFFDDDLRLGNLKLKSFPSHIFQKDGDVKFAPPVDFEKSLAEKSILRPTFISALFPAVLLSAGW